VSYEDFEAQFRGRMLLFVTEAWAIRQEKPSALGQALEEHHLQARRLLREVYTTLVPTPPAPLPARPTQAPTAPKAPPPPTKPPSAGQRPS
jgi:hypothetical protein